MLITTISVCRMPENGVDKMFLTSDMVIHILTAFFEDKLIHISWTSLPVTYAQLYLQLSIFDPFNQFFDGIT